ncbi:MAG: hypothetical protein HQL75_12210, partial [Magnetococcales bacterium]|nr:hypothetical protein [Magnetococcales bacterium]
IRWRVVLARIIHRPLPEATRWRVALARIIHPPEAIRQRVVLGRIIHRPLPEAIRWRVDPDTILLVVIPWVEGLRRAVGGMERAGVIQDLG